MTTLTLFLAVISFAYGAWCAITGTIWVGSRSYHGTTRCYTRQEEPLQFWFWCVFFLSLGALCGVGALMGDS